MSEKETNELSEKLHYGLALAQQKMLEKKANKNQTLIEGSPTGEIVEVPAQDVLDKITTDKTENAE